MTDAAQREARAAAEGAARSSYGRLLAILAARTRDVAGAEDALAEAFAAALRTWPERGVPRNPEAWLLVAARRQVGAARRHGAVAARAQGMVEMLHDELMDRDPDRWPDERLKLLFACAHPAVDEGVRTPLMLQAVLGLSAERIGRAFLLPGPTIGQRLVRAKARLRDAGIPFAVPEPADLPARMGDVLEAVYAAFGAGWDDLHAFEEGGRDLVEEALYLARLVAGALPGEPEPKGLLALMLHCEARRPARLDARGRFVPLSEQDRGLWRGEMVREAEALLAEASRLGRPGRFQTEAAIQSVHAGRTGAAKGAAEGAATGAAGGAASGADRANGWALLRLYDHLALLTGSVGAELGRAVAHADHGEPARALAILDGLPAEAKGAHQPYWVARAHVLTANNREAEAAEARERAIALTADPAVRRFLEAGRRLAG